MTKLTIDVALDANANLTIKDTTGFTSDINLTGFSGTVPNSSLGQFPLTLGVTASNEEYDLTDGYFINVLMYNKYNTNPVILDIAYEKIEDVNYTDYNVNFVPKVYKLGQDGVYSFRRYFIISKEYYDAQGVKPIGSIYYDGTTLFKTITGEIPVAYLTTTFITDNPTVFTGIVVKSKFVATAYLNACKFKLNTTILDSDKCSDSVRRDRDLIYMTIEVINYLKELNNTSEIQHVIESLNLCGSGICKSSAIKQDCNCG